MFGKNICKLTNKLLWNHLQTSAYPELSWLTFEQPYDYYFFIFSPLILPGWDEIAKYAGRAWKNVYLQQSGKN